MKVLVAQLCPTLCHPMDCNTPASSVHVILQARILKWVAILFSRGSSRLRIKPTSPALQADSSPSEPGGRKWLNIMLIHNLLSGRECFTQKKITFAVSLQILKTEKLVITVMQWENTSLKHYLKKKNKIKHYLIILECFKRNRKDSECCMCRLLLATFNNLYKRRKR